MDIHVYMHSGDHAELAAIKSQLAVLVKQGAIIMGKMEDVEKQLDDILADVTGESTKIDSLSTLLQGLKDQLAAALAANGVSQAIIDKSLAIFTTAEANKVKIDAAIASGTPPTV